MADFHVKMPDGREFDIKDAPDGSDPMQLLDEQLGGGGGGGGDTKEPPAEAPRTFLESAGHRAMALPRAVADIPAAVSDLVSPGPKSPSVGWRALRAGGDVAAVPATAAAIYGAPVVAPALMAGGILAGAGTEALTGSEGMGDVAEIGTNVGPGIWRGARNLLGKGIGLLTGEAEIPQTVAQARAAATRAADDATQAEARATALHEEAARGEQWAAALPGDNDLATTAKNQAGAQYSSRESGELLQSPATPENVGASSAMDHARGIQADRFRQAETIAEQAGAHLPANDPTVRNVRVQAARWLRANRNAPAAMREQARRVLRMGTEMQPGANGRMRRVPVDLPYHSSAERTEDLGKVYRGLNELADNPVAHNMGADFDQKGFDNLRTAVKGAMRDVESTMPELSDAAESARTFTREEVVPLRQRTLPKVQTAGQGKTAEAAFTGTFNPKDPEHAERLFTYMRPEERNFHRAAFFREMFRKSENANDEVGNIQRVLQRWDNTHPDMRRIMAAGDSRGADTAMEQIRAALVERGLAGDVAEGARDTAQEATREAARLRTGATRAERTATRVASRKPGQFPLTPAAHALTLAAGIPGAVHAIQSGNYRQGGFEMLAGMGGVSAMQRWITSGHALTVARALRTPPGSPAWPKIAQALGVPAAKLAEAEKQATEEQQARQAQGAEE
jgi:hypothetical protein